jgi:alpha/beta superfamily hydrolase
MIAEKAIELRTPDGESIEARIAAPDEARGGVVVCHPHPLYGGDMDNPVVVRAVEVCADLGLATARFNFRGVGRSTGRHGDGIAERADAQAAIAALRAHAEGIAGVAVAGYSFGALVAAHVAALHPELAGLCLIAPPLGLGRARLPTALSAWGRPLALAAGTRDDYCPAAALDAVSRDFPVARISLVEGANHFFLGKLFPLGEIVAGWARAAFPP